jgi:hypothetical protein
VGKARLPQPVGKETQRALLAGVGLLLGALPYRRERPGRTPASPARGAVSADHASVPPPREPAARPAVPADAFARGFGDMLLKLVAGVVSAFGLAGFVAVLGGAVVWVRLHSVDLPADQAVAVIPNSQLVVTGAAPLVFFLVLGALAVVGVYVAEPSGVASTRSASAIVVLVGVELGYAVVSGGFRSEARSRSSGSSRSTRSRRSGCSGAGEGGAGTASAPRAQARRPPPRSSRSTERRGSSSATSRSSSGFPGQASPRWTSVRCRTSTTRCGPASGCATS